MTLREQSNIEIWTHLKNVGGWSNSTVKYILQQQDGDQAMLKYPPRGISDSHFPIPAPSSKKKTISGSVFGLDNHRSSHSYFLNKPIEQFYPIASNCGLDHSTLPPLLNTFTFPSFILCEGVLISQCLASSVWVSFQQLCHFWTVLPAEEGEGPAWFCILQFASTVLPLDYKANTNIV